MKKLKLIRIDETPKRFLGSSLKVLMDLPQGFFSIGVKGDDPTKTDSFLTDDRLKGNTPYSFLRGREEDERNPFLSSGAHPRIPYPENSSGDIEIPPYFIEQIIRTNNLILGFNSELEQERVSKNKIDEFQHDGFKIGLRITEGILLQFSQSWLASQQFDLAQIHIENTIITLENFEEDKIGSRQKIKILKQNCYKLIFAIRELKEYFGLD